MTLIVIADTVPHAKQAGKLIGGTHTVIPCSPRSIAQGAARGFADVRGIVCDTSVWPLDDTTMAVLTPYARDITLVDLNLSDPERRLPA